MHFALGVVGEEGVEEGAVVVEAGDFALASELVVAGMGEPVVE